MVMLGQIFCYTVWAHDAKTKYNGILNKNIKKKTAQTIDYNK